jgi:hypothetical protein
VETGTERFQRLTQELSRRRRQRRPNATAGKALTRTENGAARGQLRGWTSARGPEARPVGQRPRRGRSTSGGRETASRSNERQGSARSRAGVGLGGARPGVAGRDPTI